MADDAPRTDFFALAADIAIPLRQIAAVRTLFTTEHAYDAGVAGFDGPTEPGTDGGFSVLFDGRHSIPSVVLNGSDGEITVSGYEAIRELANALLAAEKMAARQALKVVS